MISRNPMTAASLGRHGQRRRIRRTAAARLFCSTNGCTTYLELDPDGRSAHCPICGLQRRVRSESAVTPARPH